MILAVRTGFCEVGPVEIWPDFGVGLVGSPVASWGRTVGSWAGNDGFDGRFGGFVGGFRSFVLFKFGGFVAFFSLVGGKSGAVRALKSGFWGFAMPWQIRDSRFEGWVFADGFMARWDGSLMA